MIDWIFSSEEYTQLYHQYFQEFLDTVDIQSIISQAKELIAPYVEKDPTKFCTYEEFEAGVETLAAFCDLRSQSVAQQLASGEANVDASAITLSDMGTMNNGMGGGMDQRSGMSGSGTNTGGSETQIPSMPGDASGNGSEQMQQMPGGQGEMQMPSQGEMPQMPGQAGTVDNTASADGTTDGTQQFPGFGGQGGMAPSDTMVLPEGMELPDGMEMTAGMEIPEGMEMTSGMEIPEGMEQPEGMEDMFSQQSGSSGASFPSMGQATTNTAQSTNQWTGLIVSIVFLAFGLLLAFMF